MSDNGMTGSQLVMSSCWISTQATLARTPLQHDCESRILPRRAATSLNLHLLHQAPLSLRAPNYLGGRISTSQRRCHEHLEADEQTVLQGRIRRIMDRRRSSHRNRCLRFGCETRVEGTLGGAKQGSVSVITEITERVLLFPLLPLRLAAFLQQ